VFAKALDDSCILYGVLEWGFNGAMAQGESEMIASLFIEGTRYSMMLKTAKNLAKKNALS
jgi:hypothetical protein